LAFPGLFLGLRGTHRYVGGRKNSKALREAEARADVEAVRVAKVERVGSKDEAVEAWWPVDHDKTLSRFCPVQKSKNFVSRGAEHSAALRVPFRLGGKG
jgi:hypothetical protein